MTVPNQVYNPDWAFYISPLDNKLYYRFFLYWYNAIFQCHKNTWGSFLFILVFCNFKISLTSINHSVVFSKNQRQHITDVSSAAGRHVNVNNVSNKISVKLSGLFFALNIRSFVKKFIVVTMLVLLWKDYVGETDNCVV